MDEQLQCGQNTSRIFAGKRANTAVCKARRTVRYSASIIESDEARGTRHAARRTRSREAERGDEPNGYVLPSGTEQRDRKKPRPRPTNPHTRRLQQPPADAYLSDKSYCAAGQLKVNFKRACSVPPPATAATAPPPSPSPSLPPPSPSPPRCLPTNNVNDVDDVPAPSWRTHIPSLIVDYGHAYL
ncbi:hypothetical protein CPAR01_15264 [Colletotrichum paranaense]|uniref:Uncharacterized protein n=1 Tax=Colletotrichum paranaense TaxID=1914294 RepID=A0ABQ9S0G3_9PEZI|nr:uncharacterized protein CPAR01_15264 [Colletotrichum paranaense]KAK1520213.1 hypothetical protein CPAR01_15264 [Colletotrichum paranaense]